MFLRKLKIWWNKRKGRKHCKLCYWYAKDVGCEHPRIGGLMNSNPPHKKGYCKKFKYDL